MASFEAVRRKLRAVTAVIEDTGASEHERANAETVKKRLEQQLRSAGAPRGDWTDNAFRLGEWVKEIGKSEIPAPSREAWTDNAFRLGKALRRGYKRWSSS